MSSSVVTKYGRTLKSIVRQSYWMTCAAYVTRNQLSKFRQLRGNIETDSGTTHAASDLSSSIAYIDLVFREYKEEAKVDRFFGRVAEIGPGDNCGVGLLFLEDGCVQVDLADRFYSRRNSSKQVDIYRSLVDRSERLKGMLGTAENEQDFRGINRYYGLEASAENFFVDRRGYDFIVSRAVLEHVRDPILSLHRMSAALNEGGSMLHAVDLRDHGMFSSGGHSPLKLYEVPSWLYHEMAFASGYPNRVPLSAYRDAFPRSGYDVAIKVTSLVGQEILEKPTLYSEIPSVARERALAIVRSERSRFAKRFRTESDEDLSIASFFLVVKKNTAGSALPQAPELR